MTAAYYPVLSQNWAEALRTSELDPRAASSRVFFPGNTWSRRFHDCMSHEERSARFTSAGVSQFVHRLWVNSPGSMASSPSSSRDVSQATSRALRSSLGIRVFQARMSNEEAFPQAWERSEMI